MDIMSSCKVQKSVLGLYNKLNKNYVSEPRLPTHIRASKWRWRAINCTTNKELLHETRRFVTAFTKTSHLSLYWATPPSYFFKIDFNIIQPSTPQSSKWSLLLSFSHETPVCTLSFPNSCYILRPSHPSWDDESYNTCWGIQIVKLFTMQFSSVPCYFIPLNKGAVTIHWAIFA
jgi:hypothetical protein